ncbi:unnamed protein product [Trifolium pratense]|uniref:Uncharacterized protein n=1 Tax=Trifolium pratense TaxID=57577 RepID=A0ACB0KPZ5_TRIPR|nr:unnamed protein product [Trifolium pratense]
MLGASLFIELKYKEQAFDEKIEKIFNLAEKVDSESISVGKAAVGNLLGGIRYFYGQSKIALSRTLNDICHCLFTNNVVQLVLGFWLMFLRRVFLLTGDSSSSFDTNREVKRGE